MHWRQNKQHSHPTADICTLLEAKTYILEYCKYLMVSNHIATFSFLVSFTWFLIIVFSKLQFLNYSRSKVLNSSIKKANDNICSKIIFPNFSSYTITFLKPGYNRVGLTISRSQSKEKDEKVWYSLFYYQIYNHNKHSKVSYLQLTT